MKALTVNLATPVTRLILIGGGEFSFGETREIDTWVLAHMPPERRTIAFLPTASGSNEYATHLGRYFQEIDPSVVTINVPVYRGRDSRRQKNLNHIAEAGMIYLGGGVTNNLLGTLAGSPAEMAMRSAAENGAIVAAIGAAASCFGVYARDMRGATGALPSMGWLAHTVVETGFEPANDTTLRRLMSFAEVELGLGIPAQTALAIASDGTTELLGSGTVAAFRKS